MTDHNREVAEKIVAAFKAELSDTTQKQIADARFEALTRAIREALSEERADAAELVENVVKQLRAEVEKPELGL